jgi:uncharacterized protein YuzE
VRVDQPNETPTANLPVGYRWDLGTKILSARWSPERRGDDGLSGSVGIEGADGSWVILDVEDGAICGVEIAVWPDVRDVVSLNPPLNIHDACIFVPSTSSIASLQMATRVAVEAGASRQTYHFRVGGPRIGRTIRLASDLLLDVDEKSQISGFWMLNVPPCPSDP